METTTQTAPFEKLSICDEGDISRDVDLSTNEFMPFPGRMLVRRFKKDEATKAGLILPEQARQTKNWAEVLLIPPDAPKLPGLGVGTVVCYLQDSGIDMENIGSDLLLLDFRTDEDHDLLGYFRPKADAPESE